MKKNDSKHAVDHDGKVLNEDPYLEIAKSHKDWYNISEMGKQRGKPKYAPPKVKKEKKNWK